MNDPSSNSQAASAEWLDERSRDEAQPCKQGAVDLDQRVAPLHDTTGLPFVPVDVSRPCGGTMKGFALLHLLDSMDAIGPGTVDAWRDTLPLAARAATDRKIITSVAWIPVEYYFDAVTWLTRRQNVGPRGALSLGHEMASRDIGAFFRFVLGFTTPSTVVTLSGRFWKSYFSLSTLRVTDATDRGCLAHIEGWPLQDEVSAHELAGSLVAWMEASRAKDVRISRFERKNKTDYTLFAEWS